MDGVNQSTLEPESIVLATSGFLQLQMTGHSISVPIDQAEKVEATSGAAD